MSVAEKTQACAFVTGGGGALGRAAALRLAGMGYGVAIFDRDPGNLDAAAASLRSAGADVLALSGDVTHQDEVQAAVAQAESALGPVAVLVNNAGFARDAYLTKMDPQAWSDVLDVVLQGAFHCSRAVLPGMMRAQFGRIINISSRAHRGNPGQTNYSAAKAGLIGFTRSLALESGKFGITVNAIAPGVIVTPRLKTRSDFESLTERAKRNTPVGRLGTPEDVAHAIAFLAARESGFITGETLHVTGGRS